jgi:PAS domain S-box-containing protein
MFTLYCAGPTVEFAGNLAGARLLQTAERCGRLGCWTYDSRTDVFVWSASLADIFGLALQGPRTSLRVFLDRAHPKDRAKVRRALRSAALGAQRVEWQETVVRPDGSERRLRCCSELAPGRARGKESGLLGVSQDVTDMKRCEEELLHARRMQAAGVLAAGAAHDLNNLLTVIAGQVDLMQGGFVSYEAALAAIGRAVDRSSELTASLLRFCRKNASGVMPVDLGTLVRHSETLLRSLLGKGVAVRVDVKPGPHLVRADPAQIEQVVFNLATNARDAMPKGGEFRMDVFATPGGGGNEGRVVLRCQDTGCGMDDGVRARVFEPFFTTKPPGKGTGLGLAQVRETVREAGGDVAVRSEPGRGTTFEISFPQTRVDPGTPSGPA